MKELSWSCPEQIQFCECRHKDVDALAIKLLNMGLLRHVFRDWLIFRLIDI